MLGSNVCKASLSCRYCVSKFDVDIYDSRAQSVDAECEREEECRRGARRQSVPVMRYRHRLAARAPLASQEDITASLRSSFSSLRFDSIRSSLLESSDSEEPTETPV